MQHLTTIGEIKARASGIGLAMTRLAILADVAPSSVLLRPDGSERDMRTSTLQKLSDALFRKELELRDYLNALHPPSGFVTPVQTRTELISENTCGGIAE